MEHDDERLGQIGPYQLLEVVGREPDRTLYLAQRENPDWRFWLLDSATPLALPGSLPKQEHFEEGGHYYASVPVAGSTFATVVDLLSPLDFDFVAPRWVTIAEQVGYLHQKKKVYQSGSTFGLHDLIFGGTGNPTLTVNRQEDSSPYLFPAPEMQAGRATPAADVYSLGASFLAVVLDQMPDEVFGGGELPAILKRNPLLAGLLRRATSADPAQRPQSAEAFARVMKEAVQPHAVRPLALALRMVAAAMVVLLLLALGWSQWRARHPVEAAVIATVLPSPTPLIPTGDLTFERLVVGADGAQGQLHVLKGTQMVPDDIPAEIALSVNGEARGTLTLTSSGSAYPLPLALSPAGSTVQIAATVDDASRTRTFYIEQPSAEQQPGDAIASLRPSTMQVDRTAYPDVVAYFDMRDESGQSGRIAGATKAELTAGGQGIASFQIAPVDQGSEPTTVALVVDVSGSMEGEFIDWVRRSSSTFVEQLPPTTALCLYSFATLVTEVLPCTTDRAAALTAINNLVPVDDTALYDALVRVSSDLRSQSGRRTIILLSDGADTASQSSLDQAIQQTRESNVPLYAIGLQSEQFDGAIARQLAEATGGIYLEAGTPADLPTLYGQIQQTLANQYRLSFRMDGDEQQEGNLLLRLIDGTRVIEFKKSFFAP